METNDPHEVLRKRTRASFIEEDDKDETPLSPPQITKQPATPPAVVIPGIGGPPLAVTSPRFISPINKPSASNIADLVPDLHGLAPKKGLSTEIHNHDSVLTREAVTSADNKPVTSTMPGGFFHTRKTPAWYVTGWTASSARKRKLEDMLPSFLYGEWYHNGSAIFLVALVSFVLAKINASIGTIILFCLFLGNNLKTRSVNI